MAFIVVLSDREHGVAGVVADCAAERADVFSGEILP